MLTIGFRHGWVVGCLLWVQMDSLVKEIRNSSALAMELGLSCTNASILCPLCTFAITTLCSDNSFRQFSTRLLSEPMLNYFLLNLWFNNFPKRNWIWKCHLGNGSHFVSASMCKDWLCHNTTQMYKSHKGLIQYQLIETEWRTYVSII